MAFSVTLSSCTWQGGQSEVYSYSHGRPAPFPLPTQALAPAATFDKQQPFELPEVSDALPHATFGVLNGLGAFMCQPGAKDLHFRFASDEDMQAVLTDDGARILKHAFLLESLSQLRYGGQIDDYAMEVRGRPAPPAATAPLTPPVDVPVRPLPKLPDRLPEAGNTPAPPTQVTSRPCSPGAQQPGQPPAPPASPPATVPGHRGRPDPHSDGHSPLPMRDTSGNPHGDTHGKG